MKNIKEYISKIYNAIYNWFNKLTTLGKLVVCVAGVIVLALVGNMFSNVKPKYEVIDYDKVSTEDILSFSVESNDRLVFLKAEEVVTEIFDINSGNYYSENKKISVKDYYDYVFFYDYKHTLNLKNFKKRLNTITSQFEKQYGVKRIQELKMNSIISKVYDYSPREGMYVVKLNIEEQDHYVGIKFSTVSNTYTIFLFE